MIRKTTLFAGTTPTDMAGVVGEFMEAQGWTSIRIPVRPEPSARWGWCTASVRGHIKKHGGEMVLGWIIWVGPLLVEGEAHAVWRSPTGELIDITPKPDGEKEIVFCPDPAPDGWDGTGKAPSNRVRRLASVWELLRDYPDLSDFKQNTTLPTRPNPRERAEQRRKIRRRLRRHLG